MPALWPYDGRTYGPGAVRHAQQRPKKTMQPSTVCREVNTNGGRSHYRGFPRRTGAGLDRANRSAALRCRDSGARHVAAQGVALARQGDPRAAWGHLQRDDGAADHVQPRRAWKATPAYVNGRVGGPFDPASTPAMLKGKRQLRQRHGRPDPNKQPPVTADLRQACDLVRLKRDRIGVTCNQ